MGPILTAILGSGIIAKTVGTVVDRVIPDKNLAERTKTEIMAEFAKADIQGALAQIEVNKVEAAHQSLFVAGWRPFIGWVCGVALAYQYVLSPMLTYITNAFGLEIPAPPTLGENLYELVIGMLGMGAMRSFEKYTGVVSK